MSAEKRVCTVKYVGRGGVRRPCNRKPLWVINYLGAFCNYHFEEYFTTHAVDAADITRLSEEERDFVIKSEPGKGSGYGGKQIPRQVANEANR